MPRLGIIANDPIDLYLASGYNANWLKDYFNPTGFFDEVYSLAPYEHVDGNRVGVIPMPTAPEKLSRRLRELKIDVVRAYGGAHPCEIACYDKAPGIPVVVSVHDALPGLLHHSIVDADVVLSVSGTVTRLVASRLHKHDRVWLLPNRVDFEVMRPYKSHETLDLAATYPFKYRILQVGRKVWEKNLDNLIRALRLLGPEYCLLASGKGPRDRYAALAEQEGVLNRCFFIDAIPNEELARYFSLADCTCMPSRSEAFGIVVIEALASGAMVVASGIPALQELIAHGKNGLLVSDHENPAAIAHTVRMACTDYDVRQRAMRGARQSVERFERTRIDALEAVYYQNVLDLRNAGAFAPALGRRVGRSIRRTLRTSVPTAVKAELRRLVHH